MRWHWRFECGRRRVAPKNAGGGDSGEREREWRKLEGCAATARHWGRVAAGVDELCGGGVAEPVNQELESRSAGSHHRALPPPATSCACSPALLPAVSVTPPLPMPNFSLSAPPSCYIVDATALLSFAGRRLSRWPSSPPHSSHVALALLPAASVTPQPPMPAH
ncbi:hypothetical protein [Oryza sativa Japonica Group]|uniref:Os01g0847150 protein n=2 Tax=Oryza sativa subsp. japonica TaxID=39947 RepID=A0A0P0VA97_ORYSJ|nr:hypothetical protein [Oryza sativa Japonica Group]BAD82663.1 hypothetical protein [Oryza sativa Japonica Group]BAS75212.1 Os01g0847150 [Oryza sativa Japonica Group]